MVISSSGIGVSRHSREHSKIILKKMIVFLDSHHVFSRCFHVFLLQLFLVSLTKAWTITTIRTLLASSFVINPYPRMIKVHQRQQRTTKLLLTM
jgi:hypothetical protein